MISTPQLASEQSNADVPAVRWSDLLGFPVLDACCVKEGGKKSRFPLIELGLNTPECLNLVKSHGWPEPKVSACWMCPNLKDSERMDLTDEEKISTAIRALAAKMPTYVTIKDVKKRWGHGQEDVFPVTQFEKLWVDMTALPEIDSRFVVVPRLRGQQLKDQAQLDGWLRDGSAEHVESLCDWQ